MSVDPFENCQPGTRFAGEKPNTPLREYVHVPAGGPDARLNQRKISS